MSGQTEVITHGWCDSKRWSTDVVPAEKQFDYWRDFICQAFLPWSIARARWSEFPAFLRHGRYAGCRVTNLTCAQPNVKGVRGRAEISRDGEAL